MALQHGQFPQPSGTPANRIERGGKSPAQWIRYQTHLGADTVPHCWCLRQFGGSRIQLAIRVPLPPPPTVYGTRDGEEFEQAVANRFAYCNHEVCQAGANAQIHVHANGRTIWYGVSKPDGAVFPPSAPWLALPWLAWDSDIPFMFFSDNREMRLRCHYASVRSEAVRMGAAFFDAVPLRQIHRPGTGPSAS